MNHYIEKLFKQYPFVYRINNEYYAFGTGVCAKLNDGSLLLQSRYERYKKSLLEELSKEEAYKVFRVSISEAKWKKDSLGYQGNDLNNFIKLNCITEQSIREFANQEKVTPGIVVARLQHDRKLSYDQFNYLKK